jgi:hypothetical protein
MTDAASWVVDLHMSAWLLLAGIVLAAISNASTSTAGFTIAAVGSILAACIAKRQKKQLHGMHINKENTLEIVNSKYACVGEQDIAPPAISIARAWLQMARDARSQVVDATADIVGDVHSSNSDFSGCEASGSELLCTSLPAALPSLHDYGVNESGGGKICYEALLERKQNEPWGFTWNVLAHTRKQFIIAGVSADSPGGRWSARQQELRLPPFAIGDELIEANGAKERASIQRVMADANAVLLRIVRSQAPPWEHSGGHRKQPADSPRARHGMPAVASTSHVRGISSNVGFHCKVRNTFIHVAAHGNDSQEERLTQSEPTPTLTRLSDIAQAVRAARRERRSRKDVATDSSGVASDSARELSEAAPVCTHGRLYVATDSSSCIASDSAWENAERPENSLMASTQGTTTESSK